MRAPWEEAKVLQRRLPDDALKSWGAGRTRRIRPQHDIGLLTGTRNSSCSHPSVAEISRRWGAIKCVFLGLWRWAPRWRAARLLAKKWSLASASVTSAKASMLWWWTSCASICIQDEQRRYFLHLAIGKPDQRRRRKRCCASHTPILQSERDREQNGRRQLIEYRRFERGRRFGRSGGNVR
jgi:hypothetical protein